MQKETIKFDLTDNVRILDEDCFYYGRIGIVSGVTVLSDLIVYKVTVGNVSMAVREENLEKV